MESFLDEIKRYVRFEAADETALRDLLPHATGVFEGVVDEFYERVLEHSAASSVLQDEAQVLRLKWSLREWLTSLFEGPWGEDYFERRSRIGRAHVAVRLPQRYMLAAMSLIRRRMSDVVGNAYADDAQRRRVARTALDKIIDIELAIMLETYREDYVTLVSKTAALENELLQRKLARAEQLAMLGTLSAGLAHEIRNPLNAAKLQLLLVERRLGDGDPAQRDRGKDAAQRVRVELERLEYLVQDFLAFARPSALHRADSDLQSSARAVVDLLGEDAGAAGVALELTGGDRVVARCDDDRVKQVLINLTRNAIEAAGAGGTVVVSVNRVDDAVELEVSDTGPGVPDGIDVFAPFSTSKDGGTGLGLSIVHRIVADHGGDIDYGRHGDRTVFRVRLPAVQA